MATNLSGKNGRCNFGAFEGDDFVEKETNAAGRAAEVNSPPASPGPVQIAYEYERHCCNWTAVAASTSTIAATLCPHNHLQRRFCSVSSPSSPRASFRISNSVSNNRHPTDHSSSSSNHSQFLSVPTIIQRIHRRMSAFGSSELCPTVGGDKRKKKHPQLLRLTGQRTQSCADFSNRLTSSALLPSSLAAAALSAKRIHESGLDSSELFMPFQRMAPIFSPVSDSAPASASAIGAASANLFKNKQETAATQRNNGHRPLHSTDSGSCSAPPSLSPERKMSSARLRSSRFCCSFRRTLKRTPKREKLTNESDSNLSNVGSERSCGEKKESVASVVHPSPEESHLLAKAWSRKESRTLILPDPRPGSGRERVDSCGAASSVAEVGERSREDSTFSLRRLSKAFFQQEKEERRIAGQKEKRMAKRDPAKLNIRKEFLDLMNDWEIGGTPNPWVCPSDRHLQLRAQLKSGWSVRTANARSPTTSKNALINGGISEAEQAHIQKVLERAEAGRQNEQQRICKMIERLDRLRARATGNGVTQCLLCQTEFGLLAAKSYAAMCSDCRKYVCQRNCGVETFDQKRREPIFLCKICSEYREVMWKKSGAWFYREMPLPLCPSRPSSAMAGSSAMMANGGSASYLPFSPSTRSNPPLGSRTGPMQRRHFDFGTGSDPCSGAESRMHSIEEGHQSRADGRTEQQQRNNRAPVPIPTEQQQRLKTTPRTRIIPSWVHEGLQQSSVSVDDDSDGESASSSTSSSLEPAQFRKSLVAAKERALTVKQHAAANPLGGNTGGVTIGLRANKTKSKSKGNAVGALGHQTSNQKMQRVALGRAGRMSDTDSDNEHGRCCDDYNVSRRSSPSTSPRHSLATPSSYGGDDIHNNQSGAIGATRDGVGAGGEQTLSDSRSVDSVVQSDHSAAQPQPNADGLVAYALSQHNSLPPPQEQLLFQQQRLPFQTPSPVPPPIPPRSATIAYSPLKSVLPNTAPLCHTHFPYPPNVPSRRPASAAAAPSAALIKLKGTNGGNNSGSSHESISSKVGGAVSRGIGSAGGVQQEISYGDHSSMTAATSSASLAPEVFGSSRRSTQSTAPPTKEERAELEETDEKPEQQLQNNSRNSPTFMSSPEDDSKRLRTLVSRRDAFVSLRPITGNFASGPSRAPCHKTQSLGAPCQSEQQARRQRTMLMNPSVSIESAHSDDSTDDPHHIINNNFGIASEFPYSSQLALTTPKRPHSANSLPTIDENSGTLGSIQFNLTYLVEEKQLIIHLIRAKNLKAMDKNGFSDPYVKFHLLPGNIKATKLTSRTIEKMLNPEWNEEMIYYGITEDERQRKSLRVTVLDRDRIGSDFLGETRVALRKLPLGQTKKFNLYLEHAMPMPAPEKGLTGPNRMTLIERGKLLLAVQYNIQQGSLFVTIKRCAELLGMDSTGFSDPYCKISLTPLTTKAHRQRTTIKKRTLNPEFNETIQFIVPFKDLPRKTLVIGVYDYDVGRHDDYIGGIVLSTAAPDERGRQWQKVIENPGKTFEHWHRLEVDD